VGVNAAPVTQSAGVTGERLGVGTGTPFQVFSLANPPVLPDRLRLDVTALDGTRTRWEPIDDIYAAAPDELRYVLEPATGRVTFGSGLSGARVPLGATVSAAYAYGGGLQGQVPIGAISKSATLGGGFTVTNPLPTWGAGAGESVADGEAAITRWLRHRDRLVSADDFTDLTRRTPGVDLGRVEVLPLFNPDQPSTGPVWPGLVTVLVIPRSDPLSPLAPSPDRQFLGAVCAWLEPRRLVTTELRVQGPIYVPIWVSVGIQVLPGEVPSLVLRRVRAAVEGYLSPLTGGLPRSPQDEGLLAPLPAGRGWPLDTDVRTGDIEAIATRVPGVRYVDSVRIAASGPNGVVAANVDPVRLSGLQLPAATVFTTVGPAEDPAALIGSSQPVPSTQVAVPVVPPTC
jgi:predicted phage baseplate assembly protein